jgi:uridine phosphorylase
MKFKVKCASAILLEQRKWAPIIETALESRFEGYDPIYQTSKSNRLLYVAFGNTSPYAAILVENLARLNVSQIIRLGTCGAVSPNLNVGDIILVDAAIRGEGTSKCYIEESFPAVASFELLEMIKNSMRARGVSFKIGHVWTTDGRFVERDDLMERYSEAGVLGVDMESSALYVVSKLKGISALSINLVTDKPILDVGKAVKGVARRSVEGKIMPVCKVVLDIALECIVQPS